MNPITTEQTSITFMFLRMYRTKTENEKKNKNKELICENKTLAFIEFMLRLKISSFNKIMTNNSKLKLFLIVHCELIGIRLVNCYTIDRLYAWKQGRKLRLATYSNLKCSKSIKVLSVSELDFYLYIYIDAKVISSENDGSKLSKLHPLSTCSKHIAFVFFIQALIDSLSPYLIHNLGYKKLQQTLIDLKHVKFKSRPCFQAWVDKMWSWKIENCYKLQRTKLVWQQFIFELWNKLYEQYPYWIEQENSTQITKIL